MIVIAALACGGGGQKQPAAGVASDKPVSGGTLNVAMAADVINFDPIKATDVFSGMVMAQVVESLFDVDKDGKIVGRLVEKSENPEPLVHVWTLRQGVKFTDGSNFDSEAVKFNIERHRNPDNKSVRAQDVKDIVSIETPGPFTVKITLKAPDRSFNEKFATNTGRMLSPKAVATLGEGLQRNLANAGTGPFKFGKWDKDTQVVVERNPDYWQKDNDGTQLPYLARIVFWDIPDESTRLINLKTGYVDALAGNPPYKDLKDLKTSSEISLNEMPGLGYSVIQFNTAKEPFNNAALRRAISFGIDRDQIRKTVFFEAGRTLDTALPESLSPWYQKEPSYHPYLHQDAGAVKRELASAGKANGFKFTLQITAGSQTVEQTATLFQDQLKSLGIDVEIVKVDFATLLANARPGGDGKPASFEALIVSFTPSSTDPDRYLTPQLYTKAGQNLSAFSDRDLDKAIDDGRSLLDPAKAKSAYDKAVKIVNDQQPIVVYHNLPQITSVRSNVRNFPQTYNSYWGSGDFYKIWKTQ